MPTTPNYGWDTPADTDYVTNGALSIRTLGDDADATVYAVDQAKVDRAGDTMTGTLIVPNVGGSAIKIKQDATPNGTIEFTNAAGTVVNGELRVFSNTGATLQITSNGNYLTISNNGEILRAHDGEVRYVPFAMEVGVETVGANDDVSVSLNSGRFLQAPLVFITPQSTSDTVVTGHAGNVTTSSFRLYNTDNATRTFAWQAIQMRYASAEG